MSLFLYLAIGALAAGRGKLQGLAKGPTILVDYCDPRGVRRVTR